jgi:hypothetical protein
MKYMDNFHLLKEVYNILKWYWFLVGNVLLLFLIVFGLFNIIHWILVKLGIIDPCG